MVELYHNKGSNCGQRIIWILNYKNIYYTITSALDINDNGYENINPLKKVPVLSINNTVMCESMAIAEWLDDEYPARKLLPNEIIYRAKVREVCEIVNATVHPEQAKSTILSKYPQLTVEETFPIRSQIIGQHLQKLQRLLFLDSQFCIGTSFTLADIFVAVIYNKAKAMGLDERNFEAYSQHWMALKDVDNICQSIPVEIQ